jgi:quaternary ammonium compound-resistance protein SugE
MSVPLTPNFAWALLILAGLLEIVWSVSMKASHGFTKHHFTAITLVAAGLSFWLLGLALRQLPVGTAYAVWTGVGAVGAAVLGIALFGESLSIARIGCIALIVVGILGLKFLAGESAV